MSGARVARNLAICFGASLGLFFFIRSRLGMTWFFLVLFSSAENNIVITESSRPAPASLSDEWVKATEERAKRLNADPISRHKIGQPVADPAKVNEELIKIITKTED